MYYCNKVTRGSPCTKKNPEFPGYPQDPEEVARPPEKYPLKTESDLDRNFWCGIHGLLAARENKVRDPRKFWRPNRIPAPYSFRTLFFCGELQRGSRCKGRETLENPGGQIGFPHLILFRTLFSAPYFRERPVQLFCRLGKAEYVNSVCRSENPGNTCPQLGDLGE